MHGIVYDGIVSREPWTGKNIPHAHMQWNSHISGAKLFNSEHASREIGCWPPSSGQRDRLGVMKKIEDLGGSPEGTLERDLRGEWGTATVDLNDFFISRSAHDRGGNLPPGSSLPLLAHHALKLTFLRAPVLNILRL